MIRVPLILIFLILTEFAAGQTLTYLYEQASQAKEQGNLALAAGYYQLILEKNERALQARYELAEICRNTRLYDEALRHYKILIREESEQFPLLRFWYAVLLKQKGDYEKAATSFRNFYRNHRLESEFKAQILRAKHEAELCSLLASGFNPGQNQTDVYPIRITDRSSEFNPIVLADSVLIYSVFMPNPENAGKPVFVLLSQKLQNSAIPDTLFKDADYQYSFSGSTPSGRIYFSRCPIEAGNENCNLFSTKLSPGGLQDIVQLIDSVYLPEANYRHPAFSIINGKAILFYASDQAGGFGGFDLWMAELNEQVIVKTQNLGSSVNSPADELTPFFYPADSSLFFSSEWHENYGGFDLFRSYLIQNRFTVPVNLGKEINSTYDDLSLHLNFFDHRAFFTSNRPHIGNSSVCCADLFGFQTDYSLPDSILNARKEREIQQALALVEKRVVNLQAFDLFFDNDEPDPSSTDSVTLASYDDLFYKYLARREMYISEIAKSLKGEERSLAMEQTSAFFDEQMSVGMNRLETLLKDIAYLIERGKRIEIEIESYASPLNTGEYNLILSKRRISSLMNYLQKSYPDSLHLAIEEGKLVISHRAMGDALSVGKVSADVGDAVSSIYRMEAARERRISILKIRVF